jgi:DNA (cytosine-5)-methyltransferase 1
VTLSPQFILPLADEIVVDLFAGGGGASTGIELAIGRHVDIAVNHDADAVSLHAMNHPQTRHFVSDVFEIDPLEVTEGRPVGLLWASPDCKHFSKAKGGKPVSKKIRSLAWVVVKWAKTVRPRMIFLENVEEFQTWGPLAADGRPCPDRKGLTFRRWVRELQREGYAVEWRELRACDYGAPTTRKRLFLVARRDGEAISWPKPTHGKGLMPYRTAADCIDWGTPAPSIFERAKPLADNTQRRIARGLMRYVINNPKPFIVHIAHGEGKAGGTQRWGSGAHSIDKPLPTLTTKAEHCLAVPTLVQTGYGERDGQAPRSLDIHAPLGTVVSGQKHALVAAFLAKLRGTSSAASCQEPLHTVSAQGLHHAEVRAFLVKYYGSDQDPRLDEPLHTVTTKHRFGIVLVHGEPYEIADIGLRMLEPRELYRAQGFPESYVINKGADGHALSKAAQVRMCGNSVCPPIAAALVRANYSEAGAVRQAA